MIERVEAIPSCDQIFIVWKLNAMIDNCVGFAVFRQEQGKQPAPINTWVGFEGQKPTTPGEHRPSTEWPVQKTSWTDYLAPLIGKVRYGVTPVILTGANVTPNPATPDVWSDYVTLDQGDASITAWFNRGTISAQWLTRALGSDEAPAKHLAEIIDKPGDKIRNFLAGRARERLIGHLDEAIANQRDTYAALFELNDPELKAKLKALGGKAHLVLGNSDGGDDNNTRNTDLSATELATAGVDIVRRKIAPARFAHNKFVVFTDGDGKPARVWTGSINWTETGVCTQNSNGLDLFDPNAAAAFKAHWQALHDAQSAVLTENSAHDFTVEGSPVSAWFTPVEDTIDLAAARTLINGAKSGILFLMLNPGPAGLLGPIIERLSPLDNHYNADLYIRGVLNNFPNRGGPGTPDDQVSLLTSEGKRQNFTGADLSSVLKPAAVGNTADWWQKELASTGKFAIAVHSKVIVIDPAGDNPVVMTGSHNFSNRASTKNDDNLVIVQGNSALAHAYAVNIIGIYNEFRWRAWRNTPEGQQDKGIKRNDKWLSDRIGADWLKRETRFWIGS